MYLKSLDIQGFKSFADKVKVEFGPGITAVVGPNGSGKSNISDCIRWVLGEQSAKSLRGAKMEDIIFAGSSERRPLGMAEVSLTLDNSSGILNLPYQEITVSRRVFRSGEAEYLINKSSCRLKDVHDLFNDTGLGKESFAIISQGRVEEVLNSRAEERRALIEEAAGIVKYRNRKREALKKLDETEQSISRVLDIIAELSLNLGPLQVEAEKALKYKTSKKQLDKLEIGIAQKKLQDLHKKLELLNNDIQERFRTISERETNCQTIDSMIEHDKLQQNYIEEELSLLQKSMAELTEQTNQLDNFLAVSEERVRSIEEQLKRTTSEIVTAKERQQLLHEKYNSQILAHQQLEKQIELQHQLVQEANEEVDRLDNACLEIEHDLEKLKSKVFDSLQNLANARNRYNQTCYEKSNNTQNIIRNRAKVAQLSEEIEKETLLIKGLEQSYQEKKLHFVKTSNLKNALRQSRAQIEASLKALEDKLNISNKEIHALSSRHLALLDLQKDYEGYFQGVKAVLKAKAEQNSSCREIAGVVGELLAVPAKYDRAIEIALGGSIQNLVAMDDKAAEEAINYLKNTNSGRATFLPLNTIKVRELQSEYRKLLHHQGVIGLAGNLVDTAPLYKRIVQHLLGNILVVDCLDTARTIGKKSSFNLKIVTLDGDIINPGGSLSGGSASKKSAALLARPREIRKLEKVLTLKKATLEQLEMQVADYKTNLLALDQKLEQKEDQLHNENLAIATDEHGLNNAKQVLVKLKKELNVLTIENIDLQKQLDQYQELEEDLKKQINNLEAQANTLELGHSQKQELYKHEQEKKRLQYDRLTSLKVDLAAFLEKEKAYQADLNDYYESEKELAEFLKQKSQELASLEGQKQEILKAVEFNTLKLKEIITGKSEVKNNLIIKEARRDELRTTIESLEKEQKVKLKELDGLKEALQEQKVMLARLEAEKKNELNRLEEKFQITYDGTLNPVDFEDSPRVYEEIKNLRKEISQLGEINLAAPEEYTRVKERYDFLKQQEGDLSEAKSVLSKVIYEIDQIMIKRFTQSFEDVNASFSDIYKKLFGGGKAQLHLTSPEDLLETGVDIVVQPPGKKLQNLSLLSGGERALTAIALLFALLAVKPSPFCVLDEIEASLDEVNVDRFAQFLKHFAKKTQFVVISHRQGTIEVADALYGVTMEESGVSKLISVRLTAEETQESSSA